MLVPDQMIADIVKLHCLLHTHYEYEYEYE